MSAAPDQIAIVGMAGRFPGAPDLEAFWRVIAEGRDTVSRFEVDEDGPDPEADASGAYVRARGVLDGIEDFDARFFDFLPEEASRVDPQHRVFLETAWEALESAGYAHGRHGKVISVYAGSFFSSYLYRNLLPDRAALEEFVRLRRAQSFALLVQNDPTYLPTRTAYKLDLRGPAMNVQTACSTSLVAVGLAVQGLLAGESDMAVAGGVCVAVPQRTGYFHQEGAIHSSDGYCRPYDAAASGTVFGNGVGAVVLKRLDDARRDHDPVLAVLRGIAMNNDGRTKVSYHAPSVNGQAEVIATAQALAGVEPGSIGYVEGHGTATALGDPIEVEALRLAFRGAGQGSCCLGSVKGNVGHLDAAAGVAGLIRTVLALRHKQLPATAHFERPNPGLRIEDSPFFVTPKTLPWPEGPHPRRAGVSAFGIGGTNVHAILEEAPPAPTERRDLRTREDVTLIWSARDPAALDAQAGRLADWVDAACADGTAPRPLAEIAGALKDRRKLFPHRRAVRVSSWEDARAALRDPLRWDGGMALDGEPRIVLAFPGQGTIRPGALAGPLGEEPAFRAAFEPLARIATDLTGFDLLRWAEDPQGDTERFRKVDDVAQVALFSFSTALARWVEAQGVRADAMVGHSLGEWVAAHLAGVVSAEDALRAVARRGQLMGTTGKGATLIVHLSEEEVAPYLGAGVTLACVNAPRLCLVSGRPEPIQACAAKLAAAGVEHRQAYIDVAAHSPCMDPVVVGMRDALGSLRLSRPSRRMVSAVTGRWMTDAEVTDPEYWATQVRLPVRFSDAVATLVQEERCLVVEVGFGEVLSAMVRAQVKDPGRHRAVALLGGSRADPQLPGRLRRALNELWAVGAPVDVVGELPAGPEAPVLPTYPFQRQRCWKDAPSLGTARTEREDGRTEAAPSTPPGETNASLSDGLFQLVESMSGIARASLSPSLPFSSLGLDSLFLAQLAEAIGPRLGVRASFADFAQNNSLGALAAALEARRGETRVVSLEPKAGFHGLYPIRKGDGHLPLLLVHGDVANDLLPPKLPASQTIYGYAHQGSDGDRLELRSVEALAERCYEEWIAEMRGVPCAIAGHSYGGLVALHVAHLMRAAGHPVELLVMIDTFHPHSFRNPFRPGTVRWARRTARLALNNTGFRLDVLRGELAHRTAGKVPLKARTPYILGVYEIAARRYVPPEVDVDAVFFSATDGYRMGGPDQWDAVFRSVKYVPVQGDHLSIVRDPRTFEPMGAEIARRLARLRAGEGKISRAG
jgi:acyl transferase domain-containing protein/thioesterase domain-containing protein